MGIGFPVETPENTSSGERRIFIPHVPAASTDLTLSPRRPVSLTLSPSRRPLPLPRSPLRSRSSTTSSRRQGHWDVPVCHQPSASRAPAYTRPRSFAESPSSRTASADKVGSFHSFPPESVASCGTKRSRSPSREDARASKPFESALAFFTRPYLTRFGPRSLALGPAPAKKLPFLLPHPFWLPG